MTQMLMDFGEPEVLPPIRDALRRNHGPLRPARRLSPIAQLVKSMISARTYDEVSWPAFLSLQSEIRSWEILADMEPALIEPMIASVTHADAKARFLPLALREIRRRRGALTLDFLADWTVDDAMAWLSSLPGVGCKGAAAVLNFSTLNRRAMVVDTHVHRVACRLGLASGDPSHAYEAIMEMAPADWTAETLHDLHWLFKSLGQRICTHAAPHCSACPLGRTCPRVGL